MNNILKIIAVLFFLTFSSKVYSQLDTLNYVKQFEVDKINYVNKPFSYLLAQMTQIQPKSANSLMKIWGQNLSTATWFRFTDVDLQYGRENVTLIVYWKTPISYPEAMILSKQNHFYFTDPERLFYGDKIVADILVFKK